MKPRILLAEDDVFTQFEITRILNENFNLSIITCFTLTEALELSRCMHFDYTFLDYRFLGETIDGLDIASDIMKINKKNKLYILTGVEPDYIEDLAKQRGIHLNAVLSKMVMKEHFKRIFKQYLK